MAKEILNAITTISSRFSETNGFTLSGEAHAFRPDISAWAILALAGNANAQADVRKACDLLAKLQEKDGRITLMPDLPNTFWPTSLAILAWKKVNGYDQQVANATQFLLKTQGVHYKNNYPHVIGHDTSIRGWPFIGGTHSWIEPSALAMIALTLCGYGEHPRVTEAARMILNRQLSHGGWNYGNTTVFDTELLPMPENTGQALCALKGRCPAEGVDLSIRYLKKAVQKVRSPIALSWSIFGLTSWEIRLPDYQKWILEGLALQDRYGPFPTDLLSRLVVAWRSEGSFWSYFNE